MPGTEEEKPFSKGPYRLIVVVSVPATFRSDRELRKETAAVSMHATDPRRAAAVPTKFELPT